MAPADLKPPAEPRWLWAAGMALCLVFVAAATWRDAGTYAHTFADERTYSYFSRVRPISEAQIPSYLYLKVFSATEACGDGALTCARLLNAFFFALALPFIYLVARRFASWRAAALVAAVTAVSPFNSYTAYFMPESMYFLGVWVLLWVLTFEWPGSTGLSLAAGAVVGLLALIKLHGFFLAPSAGLLMLLAGWARGRLKGAFAAASAFVGALLLVRFGGGWLIAGKQGLTVLGVMYSGQAESAQRSITELAPSIGLVLWRHVQALAVLFAVPVAATLTLAPMSPSSPPGTRLDKLRRLQLLIVLFFGPLLLVVAWFSAKVAGQNLYELPDRLHMRYYNFLGPLLLMVAAAHLDHDSSWTRRFSPRVLVPALLVLAITLYATLVGLRSVVPVLADCPDLQLLRLAPTTFVSCAGAGLLALLAWAARPKLGAGLYLFLVLPVVTLLATGAVTRELGATIKPTVFDTGAEITRRMLGKAGVERVHVLAPHAAGGFRAIFTLNNVNGSFVDAPPGSTVTRPSGKDLLLLFGDYVVPEPHKVLLKGEGYSLVQYE